MEQRLIDYLSVAISDVMQGKHRRVDGTIDQYSLSVYRVGDITRVDIRVLANPEPSESGGPYHPDLDDPPWR
jgi:hypothetical protein